MIGNLRDTTQRNAEQDWLKTNLARISGLMQGQRDLETVSRLIMSELTPVVAAQQGAFFMGEANNGSGTTLKLLASYGYQKRKSVSNVFHEGEGIVGQAMLEKQSILITQAPPDYIKIGSGLGEASPVNIIVIPILFEDRVLAVIELASFRPFSDVNIDFLNQLMETIGVVLNTMIANMRTEQLLQQSQSLAQELQSQSEELQSQQDELKRSNTELEAQAQSLKASEELLQTQQEELQQTNEELEEKATQLGRQNRDIEIKNAEIEAARVGLQEKAEQLSVSSKYKSEFLANMSHELRTPPNSLLILSKLLANNETGNLTEKQTEFATTINNSGSDLLSLINDILDLSKVEAGKMDVNSTRIELAAVNGYIERSFRAVAEEKGLNFSVEMAASAPASIITDEQRLQQVLKNLLSNAVKFTAQGRVSMLVDTVPSGMRFEAEALRNADQVVAFAVTDTGIGIAEDKRMLIFEAFQQADGTTSRQFGGTGLGLSISREITRLLGGEIHVRSVVGEGTVFTLYLPVRYEAPQLALEQAPPVGGTVAPEWPVAASAAPTSSSTPPRRSDREPSVPDVLGDDRGDLLPGDRIVLAVISDPKVAASALEATREQGFKALGAVDADAGMALARRYLPHGILLDLDLPGGSGTAALRHLKRHPDTRHIPLQVICGAERRREALAAGATGHFEQPVTREDLLQAAAAFASFVERGPRSLLIVEDDVARQGLVELLGAGEDVLVSAFGSSAEAVAALDREPFDCMVLDLKLPDGTGFDLLERVKTDDRFRHLPVIIHTGADLSRKEETALRRYAETIVVKDVNSPERLLEETSLFLHRPESRLPTDQRRMLEQLHSSDVAFEGKKVLIVDDDVRNVYALTSALETRGMVVTYAETGEEAIGMLQRDPGVDLVLMDVMMPGMDGNQATQAVRLLEGCANLPIISLTAKAMKGDRERSIAAGASDYITKPVDMNQLLSLMRVWLYA